MNYNQLWSQKWGQKFKRKLDRSSCLEGHHVIDRCNLIDYCIANRVLNELFINGVRTVRVDLLWPYFKHEPRARDNKFCVTHLAWKRKTEEKIKGAICLRRFSFVLTCALDLFSWRAPSVSRPFPLAALAQRRRVSGGRESTGGLRPQHPECVCSWPSHSTHWQTADRRLTVPAAFFSVCLFVFCLIRWRHVMHSGWRRWRSAAMWRSYKNEKDSKWSTF